MSGDAAAGLPSAALFTDLYQLTMLQAYWSEGMQEPAVFSLYFRQLPPSRNYMLTCGLEDALAYLETLRFGEADLARLETLGLFRDAFLDWLRDFRFTGDVWAMAEGVPVFENEPLLEVEAPIAEAQLAETYVMNQIHLQTVLATKASRVATAAAGRPVLDFGMRRMHGTDAAVKGARAFYVGGVDATSDVLAGVGYGLPVRGTMAHSYVEAHDRELDAFREFARLYPDTVLLVDTYDTLEGVRRVVALRRELGDDFRVSGVRLDSGDLAKLARGARAILDEADLADVQIIASGGLDENAIDELVRSGVPIDAFGVGTRMGVSNDAPTIDLAYKLTAYAGRGRLKTSSGKAILPSPKQVFRFEEEGEAHRDVIARREENLPGRPLLEAVMRGGRRTAPSPPLERVRARAESELGRMPARVRGLAPADPAYPVVVSTALREHEREVRQRVAD